MKSSYVSVSVNQRALCLIDPKIECFSFFPENLFPSALWLLFMFRGGLIQRFKCSCDNGASMHRLTVPQPSLSSYNQVNYTRLSD